MRTASDYVNQKIRQLGREILDGTISVNPYEQGSERACTYCAYKSVCGYDSRIGGYRMRRLQKLGADDALMRMREELGQEQ